MTRRTIFLDKCIENMGPNCSVCYVCTLPNALFLLSALLVIFYLLTWCWGVLWAERLGRQVSEAGGQMCRQKVSTHYEREWYFTQRQINIRNHLSKLQDLYLSCMPLKRLAQKSLGVFFYVTILTMHNYQNSIMLISIIRWYTCTQKSLLVASFLSPSTWTQASISTYFTFCLEATL